MKTGSWYTTRGLPGRVGISVGTPRGMPAGYRLYRAADGWVFVAATTDDR